MHHMQYTVTKVCYLASYCPHYSMSRMKSKPWQDAVTSKIHAVDYRSVGEFSFENQITLHTEGES